MDLNAKFNQVDAEFRELAARDHLTPEQERRAGKLYLECCALRDQIDNGGNDRAAQGRALIAGLKSGRYKIDRSGVADQPDTGDCHRDAAMRVLDTSVTRDLLSARGAEAVETLMSAGPAPMQSWTARWAAAAGSDDYRAAFAKLLTGERGHLLWTEPEAQAYRDVAALQAEQRAMSLTDASGGFMVPLTLDPAITLTNGGSVNPMRQLARVVQTTSDTWQGVTSAGVTAEWKAEAAEMAETTPTLAAPSIPVHKADAFTPFSFEIEGDAVNFLDELTKLLADAADQLTAHAYTLGTGSGQPKGIVTALAGTGAVVTSSGTEALVASDVYAVQNALSPRWQPGAAWQANLSTLNALRQFETANGALKYPELHATAPSLLGRPVWENSNVDGVINPAATESNHVLIYGDHQQYVIVDRVGSTLELVPHLFGENRRPTGQRGALLWFRTGGDVTTTNAFKVLNIPTAA